MYIIWMVDSRCKCFYCIYSTVLVFMKVFPSSTLQKKTAKNVKNATTNKYTQFLLVMKK